MAWYEDSSGVFEKYEDYVSDPNRMSLRDSFPPLRDDAISNPDNARFQALHDWQETNKNGLSAAQSNALKEFVETTKESLSTTKLTPTEFEEMLQGHPAIKALSSEESIDTEFIAALFQALDADADGTIDISELQVGIDLFTAPDANTAISRLYSTMSQPGNSTIVRSDIERMLRRNIQVFERKDPLAPEQLEILKTKFNTLAVDGKLDQERLGKALGYKQNKEHMHALDPIFKAFDRDDSGLIDWAEFVDAVRSLNDDDVVQPLRVLREGWVAG